MKQDSAIVVFALVFCLAMLFWRMKPVNIVVPDAEEKPLAVATGGPSVVRPAQYAAMPYRFLPPVIPYVENRESPNNGC